MTDLLSVALVVLAVNSCVRTAWTIYRDTKEADYLLRFSVQRKDR